ncbi:HTH-type transcriptional repressor NagR [Streptomyces sp. enrichment culture]|uniref:GntR family transcriptional regulator n=1 Tax=Streptomyces xiamenensis TaxID=408015 RepID=UPI0036EDD949
METTQREREPEPKYWHLRTLLSKALDTEFSVGEILPNERELAARFGVARATVRQALEQLELEGRLQRRRGVGTTVAPPRVGVDLSPSQHSWPGWSGDPWTATAAAPAPPPPAVARLLDIRAGEPVEVIHRILMTHGQPVATEQLYVPGAGEPRLPAAEGPDRARRLLRRLQETDASGQDRTVELGAAGAEAARRLERLPGSPVLLVTTRYFAAGRTAAVSVATYRADTCRLTFADQPALTALTS